MLEQLRLRMVRRSLARLFERGSLALIALGDGMDENLAIPKLTLARVRLLSDQALVKLIWLVNDHGWAKASQELDALAKEKV
jgi:hypothetical protein